jgi:hypothetical protein
VQLYGARARIAEAGGDLVFVGNGRPEQAADFRENFVPGATVLSDPGRRAYRALGMKRGLTRVLGPQYLPAYARANLRGFHQSPGDIRGDAWQVGGAMVVASGGEVVHLHNNENVAEEADLEELLRQLREAR